MSKEPLRGEAKLLTMLQYRRPEGGKTEKAFIKRFIEPLGVTYDDYGNMFKVVGDNPSILWSCHTDSVHSEEGFQKIGFHEGNVLVGLCEGEKGCLGADNAAGVYLLTEMIEEGIPGLYLFFRQEESGRKGSRHFALHSREMLEGITAAIAFDRRKDCSIITHQMSSRCASEEFAASLALLLGLPQLKADPTGSYTDTASFTDLIAECTNVSAGFVDEHSAHETLDLDYIGDLLTAILAADFSKLEIKRDPAAVEDQFETYSHYFSRWEDDTDLMDWPGIRQRTPDLETMIMDNPAFIAYLLEHEFGVDAETLEEYIDTAYGQDYDDEKTAKPNKQRHNKRGNGRKQSKTIMVG